MKAVIQSGSTQYVVEKGDVIEVAPVGGAKTVTFEPLMLIDGKDASVGKPTVKGATVKAKVIEAEHKKAKVTTVKFQAKKRVHTTKGHRQTVSTVEITDISK